MSYRFQCLRPPPDNEHLHIPFLEYNVSFWRRKFFGKPYTALVEQELCGWFQYMSPLFDFGCSSAENTCSTAVVSKARTLLNLRHPHTGGRPPPPPRHALPLSSCILALVLELPWTSSNNLVMSLTLGERWFSGQITGFPMDYLPVPWWISRW